MTGDAALESGLELEHHLRARKFETENKLLVTDSPNASVKEFWIDAEAYETLAGHNEVCV